VEEFDGVQHRLGRFTFGTAGVLFFNHNLKGDEIKIDGPLDDRFIYYYVPSNFNGRFSFNLLSLHVTKH
jgi:hypothetical protein